MPSVRYNYRILADESFVRWLIEKHKPAFLWLTYIKSSSIDCRHEHNVLLENSANSILNDSLIKESNLRAAFKCTNIPKEISSVHPENVYDQMIIFAISMATERPFLTYILTTSKELPNYTSSSHIKGVKSIVVKSEEDGLKVITILWREFCTQRTLTR